MSCVADQQTGGYGLYILVMLLLASLLSLFVLPTVASEDPVPFEQLINDLNHQDSEHCWNAINALGASCDSHAVLPLMAALRTDMKQRRGFFMAIIPALGQLKDERAVLLLLEALNNREDDWLAREAAAHALGDIGSAKAVPDLIRSAWMADTRSAAVDALAAIADPRAVDVLLSVLSEPKEP